MVQYLVPEDKDSTVTLQAVLKSGPSSATWWSAIEMDACVWRMVRLAMTTRMRGLSWAGLALHPCSSIHRPTESPLRAVIAPFVIKGPWAQ